MSAHITVELSDEVRSALDDAARAQGVSISEIVDRVLKRYVFVQRFRQLRLETLQHMHDTGQGELTDADVLRMEDIQYRRYVVDKVQSGLECGETEGVIEQHEPEVRLAEWSIE